MKPPRNLIGPALRKERCAKGLSQPQLAERAQRQGWDIGRDVIAKIETQARWVADFELVALASILAIPIQRLLPAPEDCLVRLQKAESERGYTSRRR